MCEFTKKNSCLISLKRISFCRPFLKGFTRIRKYNTSPNHRSVHSYDVLAVCTNLWTICPSFGLSQITPWSQSFTTLIQSIWHKTPQKFMINRHRKWIYDKPFVWVKRLSGSAINTNRVQGLLLNLMNVPVSRMAFRFWLQFCAWLLGWNSDRVWI